MNSSIKNNKLLSKRHSSLGNINRSAKTSYTQTLPIKPNSSLCKNSSEIKPKSATSSRIISGKSPNIRNSGPPLVTPSKKTAIFFESKQRKSLNNNNNKDSDIIEEQIIPLTSTNQFEEVILPAIKNTNASLSEQKSKQLSPYKPGLCGLKNIGNTCFMNSALQCLSNIPELTRWAIEQKQYLSEQNNDIIYVYTSLIQSMWSGENQIIDPQNLKEIVSRSAPIFADYNQKDSHEFMNSLFNALEKSNATSIISDLFHIHTQSQVTCTKCHHVDSIDEITTFLPLPLPKKTFIDQELFLENLIHDYCLEEFLDGSYYCHLCQTYTQAKQKTNIIFPLPRVLIIQLKRFPFDGTNQKIDTFVQYKRQHENLISNNDIYQLCAISSHVGNLTGGHYTTLAKNYLTKEWYRFNDGQINGIKHESIVTRNAYILVYLKSDKLDTSLS